MGITLYKVTCNGIIIIIIIIILLLLLLLLLRLLRLLRLNYSPLRTFASLMDFSQSAVVFDLQGTCNVRNKMHAKSCELSNWLQYMRRFVACCVDWTDRNVFRWTTRVNTQCKTCRSQWPRGLRRGSAAARLLRLWLRIPWISLLWVLCFVRYRSLCRADLPSRRVLPTVMRRCVWSRNLVNEEGLAHWGLLGQKKKCKTWCNRKIIWYVLQ